MILFQSSLSRKSQRPRVPDGIRIYAIGDIHGRADLLDRVLKRIDTDLATNPVSHAIEVFLGDYVDRGSTSREVLDRLVARKRTHRTVFLKGNHEPFMTGFVANPRILADWQRLGGLETLMSYGITPSINADTAAQARLAAAFDQALPESHRRFLRDLKSSFTCGDFFFVHAGIRPGIPLAKQHEEDLLWIRQEFLMCEEDFGKIVVHGHTPVPQLDIRPNRINIDTGAYATGNLTCLMLENDKMRVI
jgi:serine/threonine protein phosphatase 1